MSGQGAASARGKVTVSGVERELSEDQRAFLRREWYAIDRDLFGRRVDWTSSPIVIEARASGALIGIAAGEAVAGMARLHDLLVASGYRGQGTGANLVREFCARASALGAARCFLRCPATPRHRRFYERLGFVEVARIPRYYHDRDFLEYLREPLP
jgi:ribosomal protein S18 acetylase RimI-like enzyme